MPKKSAILLILMTIPACPQGDAGSAIAGWWDLGFGAVVNASEQGSLALETDHGELEGHWTNLGGRDYRFAYSDGSSERVNLSPDAATLTGTSGAGSAVHGARKSVGPPAVPEQLTDAAVAGLVKSGLQAGVILGLIHRHAAAFALSPADVTSLRQESVSADVIAAMWMAENRLTALNNAALARMVETGLTSDIAAAGIGEFAGTYSLLPDDLETLRREGVPDPLISAVYAKVKVPRDLNPGVYRRDGEPLSRTLVKIPQGCARPGLICDKAVPPTEFLIRVAPGANAADYKLVRLNEARLGPAIPFSMRMIAEDTFIASFDVSTSAHKGMDPGDYAFVSNAGAMYTFRLVD